MSANLEHETNPTRALDEFSNAGAQHNQPTRRPPEGHALVRPTQALADRIVGSQQVAIPRDRAQILQELTELAAAAGDDWFYRFPVKTAGGGKDWIEGPSIKLANAVALAYGNSETQVRVIDVGDAWEIYARFTDYEKGSSMERAYHQRKSQVSMRTKDIDRQQDIAYQIGQSKAIRNVIVNALGTYCDFAFKRAQKSLVEEIGRDLEGWRQRTLDGLARLGIDVVRVERQMGLAAKAWLAPDIARVVAQGRAITDGMANADDIYPPLEQQKTKTSDVSNSGNVGVSEGGGQAASKVEGVASEPAPADPLATAYQRGKDAKANGVLSARALPGEYRDETHTLEAIAWRAGFEGNPMPTFSEENKQ